MARDNIPVAQTPVSVEGPARSQEPLGGLGAAEEMIANDGTRVQVGDDGTVTIGAPAVFKRRESTENEWDRNLAQDISEGDLAQIGSDLHEGIEADEASRKDYIDNYTKGMDQLGLKIEPPGAGAMGKKAMSRVRSSVLLKACVTFQAGFYGEMLPAAGPCKVAVEGGSTEGEDDIAEALQSSMNFYLTKVRKEYYPDSDRGAFYLGYSGNLFKKVYRCPLRRAPVSDSVFVPDLIVSEDAASIDTALRVTHEIDFSPVRFKRMQLAGQYLNLSLPMPLPTTNAADVKEAETTGVNKSQTRPQDASRIVRECYTDLDLAEYGITVKGQPDGLPLPVRVTLDKDTHQILEIRRNWKKDDPEFMRREVFVHYGLVPAFGFLCLGFLHLAGNSSLAMTAAMRMLFDAGMFNAFPAGLKARSVRAGTNVLNPGPGEWPDVDIGPFDRIQDAFMPFPYNPPNPVFVQLTQQLGQDVERLVGASNLEIGEGRANVPVGTIMAMLEASTKVMGVMHKRSHNAQQRELQILKGLFAENPMDLLKYSKNPVDASRLMQAFDDYEIQPASDPNVPSQMHRIMQAWALVTLMQGAPMLYDPQAVHKHALRTIGISDAETYLNQNPQPQGDQSQSAMIALEHARLSLDQATLAMKQQEQTRKAANEVVQSRQKQADNAVKVQQATADRQTKERIAAAEIQLDRERLQAEERKNVRETASEHLLQAKEHVHKTRSELRKSAVTPKKPTA